ncbi:DNA topoisomerase, partial [Saprospiraceae bacterium]|nr:DNA topoisomerase [Saprospiraceae bacterium]
ENFVSKPFWEIETLFREVKFRYDKGRFEDKTKADEVAAKIATEEFEIVDFEKKKGKEYAPKLFDLTGLQVFCNKSFGLTADQTLKIAQNLYERKLISYPRVDTNYLPNDQHPKIAGIMKGLTKYSHFTSKILAKPIKKTKRVFDDKKVTDHHAIIPTGQEASLDVNQQKVYDSITKNFIANFFPDCIVSNTTVFGKVIEYEFKAKGKEILDLGWREVIPPSKSKSKRGDDDSKLIPVFAKGEKGPHTPTLLEKKTQAPKPFTEATLLRAMETAGKKVDDEELRELMKANGIGRPSTRANIIETLFKRQYIKRVRKNLQPTEVGIKLISVIDNPLLKSAELTGQWERKLKEISQGEYSPKSFINLMKQMCDSLVTEVRMSNRTDRISAPNAKKFTKAKVKPKAKAKK